MLVVYGIGSVVRGLGLDPNPDPKQVRGFFGGTRYRIAIDEMPDTRDVVDLLEGVYIARREGDFYQETLLQESDGYRQKSRLDGCAPRSL